jgi:hypothetical protein
LPYDLVHPEASFSIESAQITVDEPTDEVWPSDHIGVYVELELTAR